MRVYKEQGDDLYVDMQSSVLSKFGQYTRNSIHKDQGYMSWTLDYRRLSDVDDMVGTGSWSRSPHRRRSPVWNTAPKSSG